MTLFVIAEAVVIVALVNRLFAKAGIAPLALPQPAAEKPEPLPVKKRFSVAVSE